MARGLQDKISDALFLRTQSNQAVGEMMNKIQNKVVVRFRDGRLLKGYTYDFNANRETFHVSSVHDEQDITEVAASDLKAVFFVKTFEGDKDHTDSKDFSLESLNSITGLKVKVTFSDGEVMYGGTHGYSPQRKGFFIFPADKTLNNDRIFVIKESTTSIETWR